MPAWLNWQRIATIALSALLAVASQLWLKGTQLEGAFTHAAAFLLGLALTPPGTSAAATGAAVLALCLAASLLQSCTKGAPISWPQAVACAGDVNEAVGEVTSVLLTDPGGSSLSPAGTKQLEDLALKYGAPAVLCLVDQLIHDWSSPAATTHPGRSAASERARSFLKSTGTQVSRPQADLWYDEWSYRRMLASLGR